MLEKLDKQYDVIVTDIPWTFTTRSDNGKGRSPEKHYECMTLDDIKNLNVAKLAKDDCVLFFWTTPAFMEKSFPIIKAWGFEFKTIGFTWVKSNKKNEKPFIGLGYWTRQNPEFCILATKGKPKRVSAKVEAFIHEPETLYTPLEGHSKKPENFRNRIEELCGLEKDYIELFARKNFQASNLSANWEFTGLEFDGFDIRNL